jgi:two-component system sporulation sensor kinase A
MKLREERYRTIVEQSPDAILIGFDGRFVYANDTAVKLLGAESKEALYNVNPINLIHPDYREAALERRRLVEQGKRIAELTESKYLRLDGQVVDVEVKSIPTVFLNREAVHTIVRDITQRKLTQVQLQQSEKLSVAGQLAAGIAHEIRNPITSLNGFLKLMLGGNTKRQYLQIMSEELQRIDSILNELLQLAAPKQGPVIRKNVTDIIDNVVALLESQANLNNVQLKVRHPDQPIYILCDENQLKQAFINFLKNAMESMPGGGEASIEIREDGKHVIVRFIDHGCGIPEDKLNSIGQPFFTTKDGGTGLGLSVTFNIIEMHQGKVAVTSQIGKGTTFVVTLPVVE